MSRQLKNFILFFALSLAFCYPFFTLKGFILADDGQFHVPRMISLLTSLGSPVNFTTFAGGIPITQFYPSLTFYPFSLLLLLKGWIGYIGVLKISFFLLTLLTLYSCYFVGSRMKNHRAGITFAILYTFATFRVANVFRRMAVGELLAMIILPLVIYGFYELVLRDKKKWYILSFSVSLLIYSHLISTFYIVFFLLIFSLVYYRQFVEDRERLWNGLKAVGLTLLLSLGYLGPFIEQMSFQTIQPTTILQVHPGEPIASVIHGTLYNDLNNWSPGILMVLILVLLVIRFKKLAKLQKIFALSSLFCLYAATDAFPWWMLANTPFAQIQFPMRLFAFVTLFACLAFSLSLEDLKVPKRRAIGIAAVALLLFMHDRTFNRFLNTSGRVLWQSDDAFLVNAGPLYYPDYLNPVTFQYPEVANSVSNHLYHLNGIQIPVVEEISSGHVRVNLTNSQGEGMLELPYFRYAGQVVTVNGQEVESQLSVKGVTEVIIPSGNVELIISYRYTWIALLSALISLLTLIGTIYWLKKERQKESITGKVLPENEQDATEQNAEDLQVGTEVVLNDSSPAPQSTPAPQVVQELGSAPQSTPAPQVVQELGSVPQSTPAPQVVQELGSVLQSTPAPQVTLAPRIVTATIADPVVPAMESLTVPVAPTVLVRPLPVGETTPVPSVTPLLDEKPELEEFSFSKPESDELYADFEQSNSIIREFLELTKKTPPPHLFGDEEK